MQTISYELQVSLYSYSINRPKSKWSDYLCFHRCISLHFKECAGISGHQHNPPQFHFLILLHFSFKSFPRRLPCVKASHVTPAYFSRVHVQSYKSQDLPEYESATMTWYNSPTVASPGQLKQSLCYNQAKVTHFHICTAKCSETNRGCPRTARFKIETTVVTSKQWLIVVIKK